MGHDDFRSSEAEKKAAARYIEKHLGPETHKAGKTADDETAHATGAHAGELHEWQLTSGLKRRHTEWARHFEQLENRLKQEHSGLSEANQLIGANDLLTGQKLGDTNTLNPPATSPTPPLLRSRLDDM